MRSINPLSQAAALAGLFLVQPALAAPMQVSGTFTGSCTMQDPHPLDGAGKILVSQICKAKNAGAPFEGAEVAFSQIVMLTTAAALKRARMPSSTARERSPTNTAA